jgi:glycosyltransferase involved in cell wall biosynthesis
VLHETAFNRPARVLTWHVHGAYLYYLARCGHDLFIPVQRDGGGYPGRTPSYDWPDNVHEVDADAIHELDLDVVLCQVRQNWERDRFAVLSKAQRRLPVVYLEHDPPREHPTDTRHWVDDATARIVHVTHFNRLMWDNGATPTTVIEHGVPVPARSIYSGELPRGVVVVNGLDWRGRRLGLDLFLEARQSVPLDLIGIGSEKLGGLGEVPAREVQRFVSRYRFMYSPIRYTSLGLSQLEAMGAGCPVVALATTEVVEAIENGISGYVSTNPAELIDRMHELLAKPELARELGLRARAKVSMRYGIDRFADDWRTFLAGSTLEASSQSRARSFARTGAA